MGWIYERNETCMNYKEDENYILCPSMVVNLHRLPYCTHAWYNGVCQGSPLFRPMPYGNPTRSLLEFKNNFSQWEFPIVKSLSPHGSNLNEYYQELHLGIFETLVDNIPQHLGVGEIDP